MNFQLKKKSHRSPWQARWGKTYAAATVISICIIISVLFLSLAPCQTNLPDEAQLHTSVQFSSGPGIILNYDQLSNNFRELKSSCFLNYSLKSEGSRLEIYHGVGLFQTPASGIRRLSIEKSATPGFVCRWLLHFHRDHK